MCLQTESSDGPSFHQGIGPHNDVLVPGCWFFNAVLCVYRLSLVMVRRTTKVLGPHNDVLVYWTTQWLVWFFNAVLCVYRLSLVMVRRSTKVLDHTMTSWCLAVGSLMLYCVSTD